MRDFKFGGVGFDEVEVFIRPQKWELPIELKKRRESLGLHNIKESAQPKMQIRIRPKDFPYEMIIIRIDREDSGRDYEITYDIEIGYPGQNIVDILKFEEAGQRHTHHFSSDLQIKDGVAFSDILESFNTKISASIR